MALQEDIYRLITEVKGQRDVADLSREFRDQIDVLRDLEEQYRANPTEALAGRIAAAEKEVHRLAESFAEAEAKVQEFKLAQREAEQELKRAAQAQEAQAAATRKAASDAADAAQSQADAARQRERDINSMLRQERLLEDALEDLARDERTAATAAVEMRRAYGQIGEDFVKFGHITVQTSQTAANGVRGAFGRGGNAGMAILEFSRAIEDAQYGLMGIQNNIPGIVTSLGLGAGLAGAVSLVVVAAGQLYQHWDQIEGLWKGGATETEAQRMERLEQATHRTAEETKELNKYKKQQAEIERALTTPSAAAEDRGKAFREAFGKVGAQEAMRQLMAGSEAAARQAGAFPDERTVPDPQLRAGIQATWRREEFQRLSKFVVAAQHGNEAAFEELSSTLQQTQRLAQGTLSQALARATGEAEAAKVRQQEKEREKAEKVERDKEAARWAEKLLPRLEALGYLNKSPADIAFAARTEMNRAFPNQFFDERLFPQIAQSVLGKLKADASNLALQEGISPERARRKVRARLRKRGGGEEGGAARPAAGAAKRPVGPSAADRAAQRFEGAFDARIEAALLQEQMRGLQGNARGQYRMGMAQQIVGALGQVGIDQDTAFAAAGKMINAGQEKLQARTVSLLGQGLDLQQAQMQLMSTFLTDMQLVERRIAGMRGDVGRLNDQRRAMAVQQFGQLDQGAGIP